MKKRFLQIALFALLVMNCGCGKTGEEKLKDAGYNIEQVNIHIEGLKNSYKILFVNDMHIQVLNAEVAEENQEFMQNRIALFSVNGTSTYDKWKKLPQLLSDCNPDLIAFGGDMVDFGSVANTEALKEGFDKLSVPYIYVRSDHDTECYWMTEQDREKAFLRQDGVCENSDIFVDELAEIVVVGINNSNYQMPESALETLRGAFAIGKPVVIVTHVPIDQNGQTELQIFSEEKRDGKRLYLGLDSDKVATDIEKEYLEMIYAEDSPVVAVLAAHLHFSWEGCLKNNILEHIFTPSYQSSIGVVYVSE